MIETPDPNGSPKQILLHHANQNPGELLVVSNVNGVLMFNSRFANAGSALLMLHLLKKSLLASIDNGFTPAPLAEGKKNDT